MSKVEVKILFLISFALDTNITAQGERKRHSQHSCLARRRVFRLIINRQGPVPGTERNSRNVWALLEYSLSLRFQRAHVFKS